MEGYSLTSAIVMFHSLFGNTEKVALALSRGLSDAGIQTECISIEDVKIQKITDYELIAIGGPTHMIGISKPMKAFLARLTEINLRSIAGFAFDTRNESRMNQRKWRFLENSAARRIQGMMKKMKMKIIRNRESMIVYGREGPLDSEAEDTMYRIGREIGSAFVTQLLPE
jgi:flavorubredoxin